LALAHQSQPFRTDLFVGNSSTRFLIHIYQPTHNVRRKGSRFWRT
jgi:hypothetical protein